MLVTSSNSLLARIARRLPTLLTSLRPLPGKVCASTKDWLFRVGVLAHADKSAGILRGKDLLQDLLCARARVTRKATSPALFQVAPPRTSKLRRYSFYYHAKFMRTHVRNLTLGTMAQIDGWWQFFGVSLCTDVVGF